MANADTPFGFRPVRYLSGAPYNGATNTYHTPAGDGTAAFIGDPMYNGSTGSTINGQIRMDVIQAATGSRLTGVMVAVLPDTRESLVYRAASTARRVKLADDPNLVFEIQEVSGGTAFTAAEMGLNANFVVGSGSTVTGFSGVELNNGSEATTATLDCKIVGFVNRPDNEIGEHAKWLVRLNNHLYANQVAGVS